jgi:hypothetical protein
MEPKKVVLSGDFGEQINAYEFSKFYFECKDKKIKNSDIYAFIPKKVKDQAETHYHFPKNTHTVIEKEFCYYIYERDIISLSSLYCLLGFLVIFLLFIVLGLWMFIQPTNEKSSSKGRGEGNGNYYHFYSNFEDFFRNDEGEREWRDHAKEKEKEGKESQEQLLSVLGLPPTASHQEVRQAYHKLSLK